MTFRVGLIEPSPFDPVSEWGEMEPKIIQLDIEQEAEQVKRLAIMTVPSTVLLAPDGTVADLNNGFAPHAVLSERWGRLRRRPHQ